MAIEITNWIALSFAFATLALEIIAIFIVPRMNWATLRRLPILDSFQEAVHICAEKGQPILFSIAALDPAPRVHHHAGYQSWTPAVMSIAKHVAYECGQTNVPIQGVAYMPVGAMMLRDYIREGYVEAGRGDMYNPDVVAFIPNWIVGTMWSIDYAKTAKPGAAIMLGDHWWAANIALIEALNIEDAFVIEGDIVPADNAPGAVAADVCVFGEEAVAMGAYLANDPLTSSCLIGEDVFKLFLIFLCIIIPILVTFLGVELPTGGATGH